MGQIKVEKMQVESKDYALSNQQYTVMQEDILWKHTTRKICRKPDLIWYLYRIISQVLLRVFSAVFISKKEFPQGKLVRVVKGSVFDVAVDLRSDSETYGKWFGVELTEENKKQFYIPEGFAHGFLVLSDLAEFCYKCTDFYHPGDEGGLAWNDPEIGIKWLHSLLANTKELQVAKAIS